MKISSFGRRIYTVIQVLFFLFLGSIIGTGIYWAWFEEAPLVYYEGWTDKSAYYPGESFSHTFKIEKEANSGCLSVDSNVFVIDSAGEIHQYTTPQNFNSGDIGETTFTYNLPKDIAIGPAEVYRRVIYECNPITTEVAQSDKIPFEIIEPPVRNSLK